MPLLARASGRLHHGLVIQEILDRLARLGVVVYPYLVYEESSAAPLPDPPRLPGVHCRHLTEADMPKVALLSEERSDACWRERLRRGALVMGAFHGDTLITCVWCDFDKLRTFGRGDRVLRELVPGEASVSRAWTLRAWRGRGVLSYVRPRVNAALRERGCTRLWSVCMVFNTSVRRAKARFGATAAELRLVLGLPGGFHRDLLLKRYRPRVPALGMDTKGIR